MMKKISTVWAAMIVGASLFAAPSPSEAQNRDHLKCYRGRDSLATRARFNGVVLEGQEVESACTVYVPAKLCCDNVSVSGLPPQPGGGGPTNSTAHRFCCYRVRCPRAPRQVLTQADEFGPHDFSTRRPKYLCAPASPSGSFLDE